jgi:nitrogenase molybdenum-iron protein beta chain
MSILELIPDEITERKALVVNPAKTCQPIGAMYAALGIHGCLPHSHGSQGCCSYHRMHLTRHFRDPIMASTSSFTEGASVFGGKANLKTGVKNIFHLYDPKVIAVNTTCLSETIGDDIGSIIIEMEKDIPEGKTVIHANTPSYNGSHVTGFANMVKAMVTYLAEPTEEKADTINLIPGYVEPSDMRETKRIAKLMGADTIMFPDTDGVVNTGNTGKFEMYPEGGATVEEIAASGASKATIALGSFASESGALELEKKCDVEPHVLKLPMGIKGTDEFVMKLAALTGNDIPKELANERAQLVDLMVDIHNHYAGKKVAIFGDPDIVISMTEFAISLGMIPIHVLTGTPGKAFEKEINAMLDEAGIEGANVKAFGDTLTLAQWIKQEPVDLIIGNTYGKYIAREFDIPLVRVGFPILDRVGHSFFTVSGYVGAIRLIEKISNAILDKYDRDCEDKDFELVQ